MKKNYGLILITFLVVTGCASDIMQKHVGRDITSVMAKYGPASNEFMLPDGRKAFQWEIIETDYVSEQTEWEEERTENGQRGSVSSGGGYVSESVCYYTFYTREFANKGWEIVGFEKPTFECN